MSYMSDAAAYGQRPDCERLVMSELTGMRLLPGPGHYLPGQAVTVLDFLTRSAHQNAK